MIIIRLKGGLGNQMFQYAAGRALSLELNQKLVIDKSFLEKTPSGATKRLYELECFSLKVEENEGVIYQLSRRVSSKILLLLDFLPNWRVITENEFHERFIGNIVMNGYWQSEEYFKKYRSVVLEDFKVRSIDASFIQKYLPSIKSSSSISLHVRRGDYLTNPTASKIHNVCGIDYYERAVNEFQDLKEATYFIFSDDIEWCKETMPKFGNMVFVADVNNPPWMAMFLMSQCRHNIIANSSFSWWGAWLNSSPDKVVIAPIVWSYRGDPDRNLIPADWKRC